MKKLIFPILLIISSIAWGQKLTTKHDELTGKQIKTGYVLLNGVYASSPEVINFVNDGTVKVVSLTVAGAMGANLYNNYQVDSLSIIVKFDNGDILRLKADSKYSKANFAAVVGKSLTIGKELTPEQLLLFTEHKVSMLRLGLVDDNGYDFKSINEKNSIKIQKAAVYIN